MKKNPKGHLIKTVAPDSIGEEMGIEPGDYLVAINNEEIDDVFDYQYLIKDEYIEILIRKSSGEEWILEIDKEYEEDLGIDFDNGLMSDYRSCQINASSALLTRCRKACVIPFTLKMMTQDCHFFKVII